MYVNHVTSNICHFAGLWTKTLTIHTYIYICLHMFTCSRCWHWMNVSSLVAWKKKKKKKRKCVTLAIEAEAGSVCHIVQAHPSSVCIMCLWVSKVYLKFVCWIVAVTVKWKLQYAMLIRVLHAMWYNPNRSPSIPFLTLSMAVWDLSITVEDLGPDGPPVNLSVTSELHVGGVILKLVEKTREWSVSLS